jgi:hypothetical protein
MQARIDDGSDLMSRSASSDGRGSRARSLREEEEEEEEEGEEEGGDDNYAVDKILAVRKVRDGSLEYLIKWEGADEHGEPWDDSWQPESDLTDDLVSDFRTEHADVLAAANRGRVGSVHTVPNGGAVARRERLTRPERLRVGEIEVGALPWLESEAQQLILIDIHSTGGKSPRIISLAAAAVDAAGFVTSSFHEYVRTRAPTTTAVAPVHGLGFSEVQEKAPGDFKEVGTLWLTWLRARVAGKSSAALVTAGGVASGTYELLSAELARHALTLPATTQWRALDVLRAARTSKAYAKLDASVWPDRVPATGRRARGGPNITLYNIARNALRVNPRAGTKAAPSTPAAGSRRGSRGSAPQAEAATGVERLLTTLCGDDLTLATLKMSGVAVIDLKLHAIGHDVLYTLVTFTRWAERLIKYEANVRDDPVPSGWSERSAPPGHAKPEFTPERGCSRGGPSSALREAVGTLDHPKPPPFSAERPESDSEEDESDEEGGGEEVDEEEEPEEEEDEVEVPPRRRRPRHRRPRPRRRRPRHRRPRHRLPRHCSPHRRLPASAHASDALSPCMCRRRQHDSHARRPTRSLDFGS